MHGYVEPESNSWQEPCIKCLGDGCKRCGERGYKERRVKPLEIVTEKGFSLFKAYKWCKNYNIFPISGGLINQSAKFVRAVEICDIIAVKYEKIKNGYKEMQAKQAEQFQRMLGSKRGRKNR